VTGSPTAPTAPTALRTLARLWAGAAVAIAVLAVVVLATSDAASTVPAWLSVALTVAVSAGAVAGVLAVDRSLVVSPPADDAAAADELRTRAYLQLAILEAPVLLGVALGFTLGPPWVATVGAAGGLASLVLTAPHRRRLGRLEAAWQAAGHDVSVLRSARPRT
jgi:hypothetical protein